jgi:muramidase (phage lysozyme)
MSRVDKVAPLLALIRKHESDSAVAAQGVASAYDVVYSGIPKARRPQAPLTTYPVGEVIEWQQFVTGKGAASSAAGAYQVIRKTLTGLGLPLERVFDIACQDDAALILLDRRGWDDCEAGKMRPADFADMLAREWASLPVQKAQRGASRWVVRGMSYYAGDGLNKAHATPEEVMAAVAASLKADDVLDLIAGLDAENADLRARMARLEAWADTANASLDYLEKRYA